MQYIMFTKHVQDYGIVELAAGLKAAGLDGADLCVRPGYPVTPKNALKKLPQAVDALKAEGLSVPLVTAPGDFTNPKAADAERVFDACARAGVKLVKLGYWFYDAGQDYRKQVSRARRDLGGFAKLAEKYGVKAVVHTHSGECLGCNAGTIMDLVEGFDPKETGVFLDSGHMSFCGEMFSMGLDIVKKYVACFAMKDFVVEKMQRNGREVSWVRTRKLGWGMCDWQDICGSILAHKKTNLPISVHCEYTGMAAGEVMRMAAVDVQFLRENFAAAGVK